MDNIIQKQIEELIKELKDTGCSISDPVSKLMVTALIHQTQKIKDAIDCIPDKVIERLCTYFIPRDKIEAIPSICLVQPVLKQKKDAMPHRLINGISFTYKIGAKQSLSYYPLFANLIIPYQKVHLLAPHILKSDDTNTKVLFEKKGQVWLGLEINAEVETFENLSFLIKGTCGVLPEKIYVGNGSVELAYSSAVQMDDIPMVEPFDSQQSFHSFFEILSCWKNALSNMEDTRLIYITDSLKDRDVFKCKAYPKMFQQSLESSDLDKFQNNTLWILFDFGCNYDVPDMIEILPNVVPVVNVNINSATLTQSSPIAKLTKDDGSYFVKVVETSTASRKQGFNMIDDEIIIRDFDTNCYNSNILYRDIRNLYNRFVDDYYAFIDYHGLKDGELVKSLRETVSRIGKNVLADSENKDRFDEGTYAIRNVNLANQASTIKVSYLTTFGRLGNSPKNGQIMENKKDAAIEKDVTVIVSGICGEDKATPDQRYELLRYYTLTSDRLYSKMDIEAFLRVQILKEFGKDEAKRIGYNINIQGAGGNVRLMRGLYIDITFKDSKNYQMALSRAFNSKLRQLIIDKSCISMPIIINLYNLEL